MIRAELRERRLWLTLARPEKANALTSEMLATLVREVRAVEVRDDVHAVVLTGEGGVFSAGADLREVTGGDLATSPLWEDLSGAVAACPVFTIAALNGSLAGGAMGMALAADVRIVVPGAKLFYPVMSMGLLPQPSDPGRLSALVGPAWAKRILLGGERLSSEEALAIGLVDEVAEDVAAAAVRLSDDAASAARGHGVAIKSMLR